MRWNKLCGGTCLNESWLSTDRRRAPASVLWRRHDKFNKTPSPKIPVVPPIFNGSLGFTELKVNKFPSISSFCGFPFFLETKVVIQI